MSEAGQPLGGVTMRAHGGGRGLQRFGVAALGVAGLMQKNPLICRTPQRHIAIYWAGPVSVDLP